MWTSIKKEWHKIKWSSRNTVAKETSVVLAISLALGGMIAVIDYVAEYLLRFAIA